MKKSLLILFLGLCALPCHAQVSLQTPIKSDNAARDAEIDALPISQADKEAMKTSWRNRQTNQDQLRAPIKALVDNQAEQVRATVGASPSETLRSWLFSFYLDKPVAPNPDPSFEILTKIAVLMATQNQRLIEQNEQIIALLKTKK